MTQSFYWHDYETWGANPAVDRASQFAGVRTNMDLEIIGDPLMIYCQPVPDVLPSPDACLITGITPQQAMRDGLPEPEFIRQIHREFSLPQTCVVGYNNLRFDDEITRYTLYRNFYDPYAREWQNGNSRWDVIDMVRLTYAMRPDALVWPEREPGVPSFRLELLSEANGLEHESAHDALSDVLATINLAKKIKQVEPRLFEFYFGMRNKQAVARQIDLKNHKPLVHVSSKIPAIRGCTTIVMPLLMHPKNKNAVICVDLCADIQPLFDLDAEEIKNRLYTSHKDMKGQLPVPLKAVHFNRCPVLLPLKMLEADNAKRLGIDLSDAEDKWRNLLKESAIISKAQFAFQSEFEGNSDADSALYQGFLSDSDRRVAESVNVASENDLKTRNFVFDDARMTELLLRYKARNYPGTLSDSEQQIWDEHLRATFLPGDEEEGQAPLDLYRKEIMQKKQEQSEPEKINILNALEDWAKSREKLVM